MTGAPKHPHPCAWLGCRKQVSPTYLMCRPHWYRLPAELRARIWDTYCPDQTALTASPEYLDALHDVLAYAYRVNAEAERQQRAEDDQEVLW